MKPAWILAFLLLALSSAAPAAAAEPADGIPVVREHSVRTSDGALRYTTAAGRLPIRDDESDEPRAHMFYVAYEARPTHSTGASRPLAFIWGGGPGGDSTKLQLDLMGPRMLDGERLVDNPDTLLAEADLVFVDAVGTGFSRPARPELAPPFYTLSGDTAAMTEFIRAYLAIHGDTRRPIYVGGQSLGAIRAAKVGENLAQAGFNLRGIIFISGQVPGAWISPAFDDAMYIPPRTEAALFHRRLDPELQADPERTLAEVRQWTRDVYWPAIENRQALGAEERDRIARQLARFIGVEERLISRDTLTMTTNVYRSTLLGNDPASVLSISDLTLKGPSTQSFALRTAIGEYLRDELGYNTTLTYARTVERSFMPPRERRANAPGDFVFDLPPMTPAELQRLADGYAPPNIPPWTQNALRANPETRVFVAAGQLDAMVSCLGNTIMIERLGPELAPRYSHHCYYGGHSMYQGRPETRVALLRDLRAFIARDPGR